MKKLFTLLLVLAMVLSMAACGAAEVPVETTASVETEAPTEEATAATTETAAATEPSTADYPREIVNFDGEKLVVEAKPQKVVSLVFGTDEMLLGLVEPSVIAGLSGKDNGTPYLAADHTVYETIPRVNDNAEVLMEMEPDFIIGSSWVDKDLLAQIQDAGIPYYGYQTPKTMEEQIQIIRDLGYLLGEDEKCEAMAADMENRMEAVKAAGASVAEADRVKVMAYNMHESSNAKGTIFDDMVTLAGAVNLSAQAGMEGNAKISKEQLVEMNSEVIILVEWAKDTDEDFNAFVEQLKNDESLQTVDAIKNDRVYVSVDNSITNVSQYAIEGLEFVARSCYPELYE